MIRKHPDVVAVLLVLLALLSASAITSGMPAGPAHTAFSKRDALESMSILERHVSRLMDLVYRGHFHLPRVG